MNNSTTLTLGSSSLNMKMPCCLYLSPASLKIIIEGEVLDNIQDLPKAIYILFELAYTLHLNYPKCMKNTFQFIQHVLPMLGHSEINLCYRH